MKNRATTYILIIAAAGIWAFIFYKIFTSGPPDMPATAPHVKPAAKVKDSTANELSLDYRDPFLEVRKPVRIPVVKKYVPTKPVLPKPEEKPNAKYNGMVVRQDAVYALIYCGDCAEIYKKGSTVEGDFIIHGITPDSVVLQKKGKRYVLHR